MTKSSIAAVLDPLDLKPTETEFIAAWKRASLVDRARAISLLRFAGPATELAKLADRLGIRRGGASCE